MPWVRNDPEAIEAPISCGACTTLASASTWLTLYSVSWWMVTRAAGLSTRWASMLSERTPGATNGPKGIKTQP